MKLRYSFIILAAAAGFLTGCEDDKPTPKPSPGTVKGTISPATAATQVYLIAGTDTTYATPAAAGTYEYTDVKAGDYTVTVEPKAGYTAPAPTAITVNAGKNTDVPVITLTQGNTATGGTMSVKMDNVNYTGTPTFVGMGSSGSLTLSSGTNQIQISLPANMANGTYSSASSNLDVTVSNMSGQMWSTLFGGTAVLTITNYSASTKKGNGTFSFSGAASTTGSTTKSGTNGVLTGVKLAN